jgi:hypothetical protein
MIKALTSGVSINAFINLAVGCIMFEIMSFIRLFRNEEHQIF